MTDKHNKTTGDEEYQFPQDEYVTGEEEEHVQAEDSVTLDTEEVSPSAQASSSKFAELLERFPFARYKRVLLVIAISLFGIIGFKIMTPSHSVKQVKKQPVQTAVMPKQGVQNAMLSKLDRLSQDAANSQSTISHLQSQLSNLKTSLSAANSNGAEMKNAVVALAQQVQDLTKQLKAENAQTRHHKKYPPTPILTFHLVALVPGRAWIMGSNGEADSVTVGTKLKNYGTVKAIDIYAGKVLTSSGKTITYNTDGN